MFFGSQNGTVYALNDRNGAPIWTYRAASAVKASPTLADGVLYFGDYSGRLQAISEQSGRRLWVSKSEGALLGSGNFYSTAAVVYGRVFLGNTDGRDLRLRRVHRPLDWAVQTGAYVYASPAVTNAPGLGPTVYIGSYNGTFYAINARSGQISWRFNAHGRISGSATIIGRIVYFSDLAQHRTYGLGISTGRVLFEKHTGAFDPVISDGTDVYLTGDTGLYGLAPAAQPASASAAPKTLTAKGTHAAPKTRAATATHGATSTRAATGTRGATSTRVAKARTTSRRHAPVTSPTRAERTGEREARGDHRRARCAQAHRRPSARRRRHAAAAARDRPVAREVHAHHEPPGRARLQRERVVPERRQPTRAGRERRRRQHPEDAPVRACEHLAQIRQAAPDQTPLLRARRV